MIELVITLVIFGILIGLAAPAMGAWIKRTQMTSVLNQLTADLHYARMVAVRSGNRVEVRFTPSVPEACIDQYEIHVLSNPERRAKIVDVEEDARGVCLSHDDADPLIFYSRGLLATAAARTFRAAYDEMEETVRLSQGGRIYHLD